MARHACGTGCSHTYKSHAPGQCSKARNNILVCRAWHCCQLNPPTRGGAGGGIQKKAKNANQNTQVSNNTDLGVKASNSTAHVREPQNPPQSLQAAEAWDAPSQGARHGSSVFLQNQHISFSSAQGTESKHQDSIKSPPSFCLPGRLGIGNPYNTHHT